MKWSVFTSGMIPQELFARKILITPATHRDAVTHFALKMRTVLPQG
jgi:hypothetical protein